MSRLKEPESPPPSLQQARLLAMYGYGFKRAMMRMTRQFAAPMAEAGLRPAEFATLGILIDNGGASQKQLCSALAIDPPNMATLIDRLEKKGLVSRQRSKEDERVRELHLSTKGRDLIVKAMAKVDREERKALGHLSAKERSDLLKLLRKVIAPDLR